MDLTGPPVRISCMLSSRLLVATLFALIAGTAVAALCPASAAAAGGPILVTGIPDGAGIESPDGHYRYATVSASGTSVVRVVKGSGEIDSMAYLSGSDDESFAIPQVASDGSASGLAADGGTLVLIRTFGPINQAKFVVVGTNRLHVENRITPRRPVQLRCDLPGWTDRLRRRVPAAVPL